MATLTPGRRLGPAALLTTAMAATGATALPSGAGAVYVRDDVPVALYNALAERPEYAAAGYLGFAGGPGGGDRCSGVLVAPDVFLTAAHCATSGQASGFTVGFGLDLPAAIGPSNVASILVNPAWVPASEDKPLRRKDRLANQLYDIALVKLSAPVTAVAPAEIWLGDPAGLVGTLTGYGFQDTGLNTGADAHGEEPGYYLAGAYNRLAAQNVMESAGPSKPITAVFDSPYGGPGADGAPLPLEGLGCVGDSGSPLYVTVAGQNLIVGAAHGPPPGPGGGPPAVVGCGYGAVEVWAPLADPVNVAFLKSACGDAITFVAPEPVSEPVRAGDRRGAAPAAP